ncbi:MAG: hypothetical protein ACKPB4_10305 [Sphaerospermopsis kisseleviana]
MWERPVDRRKASFALLYVEIKVRCQPIHGAANAAPEWQAGSLERRSSEPVVACPLEGLVSRI